VRHGGSSLFAQGDPPHFTDGTITWDLADGSF
jgi:hypothetical protein